MTISSHPSILTNNNLCLIFSGQCLATIASRFFDIAIIWTALEFAQSYNSIGLMLFFRFIPYLFLGLVGGWVSDRFDRKKIVFLSDMLRAALLIVLVVLLYDGWSALPLLTGTAFLLTVARTFFQPAIQGLLPDVTSKELLGHANAFLHGINEVAGIVAPVIAGFALSFIPVEMFLVVTGMLFLIAALCMLFLNSTPPDKTLQYLSVSVVYSDYKALYECLIRQKPNILIAILVNSIAVLGVGGVLSLLIPAMTRLRFPDGPEFLGILMGVIAFGTVLGAYITAHVAERHRNGRMYFAWACYGVLIACLGLPLSYTTALVISLVFGFVGAFADVLFATIIQTDMPKEHISKTFAVFSTLANCGEALSALILASVLNTYGLLAAFLLGGGIAVSIALIGIIYHRVTLWQRRTSIG